MLDLLAAQRRPRRRPSRRIADHPGEVADQEDHRVAQILKVLKLPQHHGVAQMQIRRSRIHAKLHTQRFARGPRLFELRAQIGLADNFRRSLLEVGELFVNRRKICHHKPLLQTGRTVSARPGRQYSEEWNAAKTH